MKRNHDRVPVNSAKKGWKHKPKHRPKSPDALQEWISSFGGPVRSDWSLNADRASAACADRSKTEKRSSVAD